MADQKSKSRGAGRSRNYAALVYPESAPENWRDILSELHVTALVSPLHDKDVNSNGTPKKAHYHVMVMFESVKTQEQANEVWNTIKAVPEPKPVNSVRGYARYLCHMDNPEKAQYDPADVVSMGGADYRAIIHLATDDMGMVRDMIAFIKANQIFSVSEFMDICAQNNEDWMYYLVKGGCIYIIKEYIKSMAWEAEKGYVRSADRIQEDGNRVQGGAPGSIG